MKSTAQLLTDLIKKVDSLSAEIKELKKASYTYASVKEYSLQTGISKTQIYSRIDAGLLGSAKIGRKLFVAIPTNNYKS